MKDSLNLALRFIKFRPRSVFEVETKLKSKKVSPAEIKKTIKVLKENKLLDDARFAKMWIGDRNLLRPSGSFVLRLELKKLGIGESLIETALEGQDEAKLAKRALESKSRYRSADFEHQAAFLARRGFSTSVIYKILRQNDK